MKKILLIGENSYIGNNFNNYCKEKNLNYSIDKVSLKKNNPKHISLNKYDVVVYLASIVHQKETKKNRELFFKINKDYPALIAEKAKNSGVSQFIYLSSMSVYGKNNGEISLQTTLTPTNAYGVSKLQAEIILNEQKTNEFQVAIVRPPMIYGYDSPGNYSKLSNFIKKYRIYPRIHTKRSFIYIENLCEFLNIIINKNASGTFMPQNKELVDVIDMVKKIGDYNDININLSNLIGYLVGKSKLKIFDKIINDLTYSKEISNIEWDYEVVDFDSSIKRSEGKNNEK